MPVTAAARPHGSQESRHPARAIRPLFTRALFLALSTLSASPASAQVSAAVSLFSDLRFRGYSISDGRPVGILDLSYDAPTGFYGALSGSVVASRDEGPKPLGLIVNGGYARQLSPHMSVDVGVTHSFYSTYSDRAASLSYTDAYAGISGKLVSARLNISPDYVKGGSAYGEVNANLPLAKILSFTAHAGLVVPFKEVHANYTYSRGIDWKLGLVKVLGPVSFQAAWTAVRPGRDDVYRARNHRRDAFIVGLTYSL